jgi:peptidyl-prolyl cis-trans isomerase SurA
MIKRSVASILLCYWVVLTSIAQTGNDAKPIFTVKKKPVSAAEFIYLYKKNHQNKPGEFTSEKIEEYLNLFINFKLKVAEAQQRGLDTTEAFKKEYNSYREELRKPYLPDNKLLDSLVKLTYERMKEEVKASHILITLQENATPADTVVAYNKIIELRNKVVAGEDFGSLAVAHSSDPSAKGNLGNLGYFTAMQMVYPFEAAAYSTKVGQVSMPVRTRFGYHLIKVSDRRPARGEVEVSHIMIRTGEDKDNEKSKNTIFEIYDQLQKGVSWDDLCSEYSEDPATKNMGGKMRPFGVGVMSAAPEFEIVSFELDKPGSISDPFQTAYGWHIVRLERKIPLPSFEEMAPSLKNKVSRDERIQISKQALEEKMRRDLGFSEVAEIKEKVFSLADTTLQQGKWKAPAYPNAEKEPLFKLKGSVIAVKDFLAYVQKNQKPNPLDPKKYLEQLYTNYVDATLGLALEEKIIEKSPDYKWLLKEYYEGILLFEIMEKEVWNKATEDSVGQRNYYNANASKYQAKERISGTIYSASTNELTEELKNVLQQKDSGKLADFLASHEVKHDSGSFEKEDRAVLGKINWGKGIQAAENNGVHYIVGVEDILPPGPKTFEEARPEVISDYQSHLEKKWIDELKKKHPVKVNKKSKQYVLQQLKK